MARSSFTGAMALTGGLLLLILSTMGAWAQPATDVDCVRCVDAKDIAAGAVTPSKLAPNVRARLPERFGRLNIAAVTMSPRAESTLCGSTMAFDEALGKEVNGTLQMGSASYFGNVDLPNGSVINRVTFHAMDNDAFDHLWAKLSRKKKNAGTGVPAETMVDINTGFDFADPGVRSFTETTITNPVIDLANFYYFIEINLGCGVNPNFAATGVTIRYTRQ